MVPPEWPPVPPELCIGAEPLAPDPRPKLPDAEPNPSEPHPGDAIDAAGCGVTNTCPPALLRAAGLCPNRPFDAACSRGVTNVLPVLAVPMMLLEFAALVPRDAADAAPPVDPPPAGAVIPLMLE